MAILSISLGWITMPTLSQRRAPFLVMPNTATAISSATPSTYSGTAKLISRCGGTCATMNMMTPAISMLRPWSAKRVPWSKPDEYIVSRPAQASRNTAKASGPSKPSQHRREAVAQGRFVEDGGHGANYPRWHHRRHARHPSSLPARLSLLAAVDQGAAGGGAHRRAPSRRGTGGARSCRPRRARRWRWWCTASPPGRATPWRWSASSLGGFYATWVAEQTGCKAVLLNPAVDPARDLAQLHRRADLLARPRRALRISSRASSMNSGRWNAARWPGRRTTSP